MPEPSDAERGVIAAYLAAAVDARPVEPTSAWLRAALLEGVAADYAHESEPSLQQITQSGV